MNNENQTKKGAKEKKAYMLGELRNKGRSVYTEGWFHLLTPAVLALKANFSSVEEKEKRNAFDPKSVNPKSDR